MNTTSQVVKCPNCGANNRVSAGHSVDKQPVCGQCKSPLTVVPDPLTVTDANFVAEVEKSGLPVLLDMWAPWCGPCRIIAPTIEALAKELAGRAVVGKLNVDENPRTAGKFGVQSIPTLLIIKDGREIDRIVGVQSKEAISARLRPHLQN